MAHSDPPWDVNKYKNEFESEEHWELRKKFMLTHMDKFTEDRLVCLSKVFFNMEFLGCRYPEKTMKLVEELSKGVADEHREKQKGKLKRTFVKASDAAEAKIKGQGAQPPIEPLEKHYRGGIGFCPAHENLAKPLPEPEFTGDFPGLILFENCNKFGYMQTCPITILMNTIQKNKKWNTITFSKNRVCEVKIDDKLLTTAEGDTVKEAKVNAALKGLNILRQSCYTIQVKRNIISDGSSITKDHVNESDNPLPQDNIGLKMMQKMGWSGSGLGKSQQGIQDPIKAAPQIMRRSGFGRVNSRELEIKFRKCFKDYTKSDCSNDLVFSPDFTAEERKVLHRLASSYNLKTQSYGRDNERHLVVSKKQLELPALLQSLLACGGENEKYTVIHPTGPPSDEVSSVPIESVVKQELTEVPTTPIESVDKQEVSEVAFKPFESVVKQEVSEVAFMPFKSVVKQEVSGVAFMPFKSVVKQEVSEVATIPTESVVKQEVSEVATIPADSVVKQEVSKVATVPADSVVKQEVSKVAFTPFECVVKQELSEVTTIPTDSVVRQELSQVSTILIEDCFGEDSSEVTSEGNANTRSEQYVSEVRSAASGFIHPSTNKAHYNSHIANESSAFTSIDNNVGYDMNYTSKTVGNPGYFSQYKSGPISYATASKDPDVALVDEALKKKDAGLATAVENYNNLVKKYFTNRRFIKKELKQYLYWRNQIRVMCGVQKPNITTKFPNPNVNLNDILIDTKVLLSSSKHSLSMSAASHNNFQPIPPPNPSSIQGLADPRITNTLTNNDYGSANTSNEYSSAHTSNEYSSGGKKKKKGKQQRAREKAFKTHQFERIGMEMLEQNPNLKLGLISLLAKAEQEAMNRGDKAKSKKYKRQIELEIQRIGGRKNLPKFSVHDIH